MSCNQTRFLHKGIYTKDSGAKEVYTITSDGRNVTMTLGTESKTVHLLRNKECVWKVGKKSVSTCDAERLFGLFAESPAYARATIGYFFGC